MASTLNYLVLPLHIPRMATCFLLTNDSYFPTGGTELGLIMVCWLYPYRRIGTKPTVYGAELLLGGLYRPNLSKLLSPVDPSADAEFHFERRTLTLECSRKLLALL